MRSPFRSRSVLHTSRGFARWLALLPVLLSLGSCAGTGAIEEARDTASVELKVMTFNVEWGGALISFDNVIAAIRRSDADIVGIQEAEGNLFRIATALGWHYDESNYLVSRFPVLAVPGADGRYSWVEVAPGRAVAVANVHLPSDPYGPDAVRDGANVEDVLALEKATRLPFIAAHLEKLRPLVDAGVPVFVTGDFNAPSHTDWTDRTQGARRFLRYPVAWPVSLAMHDAGFKDSWRDIHPDPLQNPGLTWWAARPPLEAYAPGENDAEDRIDFIWYSAGARVTDSRIIGERDGPEVSIGLQPWPSDHRAVVSQFRVTPVTMPAFASTEKRVYGSDETVLIQVNAMGNAELLVKDATGSSREHWQVSGRDRKRLPADQLGPGHYWVTLSVTSTDSPPPYEFWIVDGGGSPAIEAERSEYFSGEPIRVSWQNAPGLRNDYVAAYRQGDSTGYDNGMAWAYTRAMPHGELQLDSNSASWGWPLPPGRYVMRLVKDDGYESLAESRPFDVQDPVAAIPADLATFKDGRLPIQALFGRFRTLLDAGWTMDVIGRSRPPGTPVALPIIALRSPLKGSAAWLLAGIHGEEPAGPNAIAAGIEDIAELGKAHPVVLLPLLNPHGYVRNWRYLNVPVYDENIDGQSVGDSSHLLEDPARAGQARAPVSSEEAAAITAYILQTATHYPPRLSLDLHEDNLIDAGYVYSQGMRGAKDAFASRAVRILREHGIAIKMDGETRFGEPITAGIIGPVMDSSIDELMSAGTVIEAGERRAGPRAETVLVFETPARALSLDDRVSAHLALLREIINILENQ